MEMDVVFIILIVVAVILVAGIVTLLVEIQNAQEIDPDKPFLRGDEGYPE